LLVAPVELVVSSESSRVVRLARHSQNAWARHFEPVEPSGIWAIVVSNETMQYADHRCRQWFVQSTCITEHTKHVAIIANICH